MSHRLSAKDEYTVHVAAHGVVALMASSAPGILAAPRAAIAGGKALSTATGLTGHVLAQTPPRLPFRGSMAKTAELVLPALAQAVEILDRAQPGEGDNFRRTITMVAEAAAATNGGPTAAESEMLRKIDSAVRGTAPTTP